MFPLKGLPACVSTAMYSLSAKLWLGLVGTATVKVEKVFPPSTDFATSTSDLWFPNRMSR